MATIPRITSSVGGQPPAFATALGHHPELLARFARLYAAFWMEGALPHRDKEVARLRNARVTDCNF